MNCSLVSAFWLRTSEITRLTGYINLEFDLTYIKLCKGLDLFSQHEEGQSPESKNKNTASSDLLGTVLAVTLQQMPLLSEKKVMNQEKMKNIAYCVESKYQQGLKSYYIKCCLVYNYICVCF